MPNDQQIDPPKQAPTILESTDLPLCAALIAADGQLCSDRPFRVNAGPTGREELVFRVETCRPDIIDAYRKAELSVNLKHYEISRRHLLSICQTVLLRRKA